MVRATKELRRCIKHITAILDAVDAKTIEPESAFDPIRQYAHKMTMEANTLLIINRRDKP